MLCCFVVAYCVVIVDCVVAYFAVAYCVVVAVCNICIVIDVFVT